MRHYARNLSYSPLRAPNEHPPSCSFRVIHRRRVYYLLLCRVLLGAVARTQDGATCLDGGGGACFATAQNRELAVVPRSSPAVHFHSLLAETGGRVQRHREFIVFHGNYVYPEYLLAYHRV